MYVIVADAQAVKVASTLLHRTSQPRGSRHSLLMKASQKTQQLLRHPLEKLKVTRFRLKPSSRECFVNSKTTLHTTRGMFHLDSVGAADLSSATGCMAILQNSTKSWMPRQML